MPGSSVTIARRVPVKRLNNVDLPTLGRPTITSDGKFCAMKTICVPPDHACFTCHTDYALFGDYKAKWRGVHHVLVQYLGKIPKPEEIKLYTAYNNRECLHCHAGNAQI